MLWDTHMHSHFSGDSEADPAAMVAAAKTAGLSGICFTEHLDYDYPGDPELFLLDADNYMDAIRTLSAVYLKDFPILTGLELGLQPHLSERHKMLLEKYDFDFIIGSSHVVHGMDPYYPEYYVNKTEEVAYREYFSSILENITVFDGFDVYGHLDYVVRYGPNKNKYYSYTTYQDIIDEILKALIARGKGIEVNTGGFRNELGHPNPTEDIIRRYRELGGEIITLGSDAHAPEHVAYDFEKIPDLLREAGFRYFTVFEKRKPSFLPLP